MDSGSSRLLSIAAVLLGIVALVVAFTRGQITRDDARSTSPVVAVPVVEDPVPATDSGQPEQAMKPPAAMEATLRLPKLEVPAGKDELEAEAKFVVAELLQFYQDDARALHVSAMLNAQLHNTAEAQSQWERCVELEPDVEVYYVNLAAIALDRGDAEAAVETLRAAQQRGIESADMLHHLGVALLSLGEAEQALEIADQVLTGMPNDGAQWLIRGQAQLKLGDTAAAEESLKKAVALGVKTKAAYFSLLNACLRNGKREEAIGYREIYQGFQEKKLAADERYQVLSEAEARRVCISTLGESAALYRQRSEFQSAEHLYLRMLTLSPEHKAALSDLADIYRSSGKLAEEIVVCDRLTEVDPLNLINYLLLAKAASRLGQTEKAEAAIKLAISMSPQSVTGYAAMAQFLMEEDQTEKALWYLKRAVRLKPTKEGMQLLSRALRRLGREREALEVDAAIRTVDEQFSAAQGTPSP